MTPRWRRGRNFGTKWTWRYTTLGFLLGLLLPCIATLLDIALSERALTTANVIESQAMQPLLWLIDISPLLLGFLAYAVGRRQDMAAALNSELERRIVQVSEANEALAKEMSERAELEEQLRHSQKLEAVGRLAGGVAHDFNNLLTAIIGYADLLMDELKPQDHRRDYAEEIHRAGDRAAALVQQLLGLSRKQMICPRVLDMNESIRESRKLLERVIGEDVRLDLIESELPVRVMIDPVQIDQILVNLVVNARDAMPNGGTVTLRTQCLTLGTADCGFSPEARPGTFCMLEVSDDGIGMDTTTLEKIFEPFFTTKDKSKGTGLGLATTYGIVKQNGGFIDVLSHLGSGATFRIYLPVSERGEAEVRQGEKQASRRGRECVLLVEDEELVRRLASKALRDKGYEVLEAAHPEAAQQIWSSRKDDVSLLLTDVIMPGMDGRRLSQKLLVDCPDMRVLFMSGYDDQLLDEHEIFDGRFEFIPKPFTVDGLASKVREVLDA